MAGIVRAAATIALGGILANQCVALCYAALSAIREELMPQPDLASISDSLQRIAAALERLTPPAPPPLDFAGAEAFLWHAETNLLTPVPVVARVELALLVGIDR